MIVANVSKSARESSLPSSHIAARRPSLYGPICEATDEAATREVRNRVSGEKIR